MDDPNNQIEGFLGEGLPNNITVSFNLDNKKEIDAEIIQEKITNG